MIGVPGRECQNNDKRLWCGMEAGRFAEAKVPFNYGFRGELAWPARCESDTVKRTGRYVEDAFCPALDHKKRRSHAMAHVAAKHALNRNVGTLTHVKKQSRGCKAPWPRSTVVRM